METITAFIQAINGQVWGWPMIILILATGLFLSIGLRFMPVRHLGYGFKELWKGRKPEGEGDITPFSALMTSLSATVGIGNIAGVATAIFMGGPGALFWMWMTALVGMATKYAEAVLAVKYREKDARGNHIGGPMFYIRNGLGPKWAWLGGAFAVFGAIAGFGIGNGIQSNSVADALESTFSIPPMVTGIVLATIVGLVLIGGIRRISEFASALVPFMALTYIVAGLIVILMNISSVPEAITMIVKHAFTPIAATGGFAGAAVLAAIRFGVARGIFSNEAGIGSAPIAHAAAQTDSPVRQGTVAMLGTFIDTLILCTITGLVIMLTGAWQSGENGATLTSLAFETALPGVGAYVVSLGLALFAFTTILGWSYYGEKCAEYLFGVRVIVWYRLLWVVTVYFGADVELNFMWLLADTLNAMMALPNLIALLLLSPVVFKLTRDYFANRD
jgi:AGCS family alanine or glycine:cation symporter